MSTEAGLSLREGNVYEERNTDSLENDGESSTLKDSAEFGSALNQSIPILESHEEVTQTVDAEPRKTNCVERESHELEEFNQQENTELDTESKAQQSEQEFNEVQDDDNLLEHKRLSGKTALATIFRLVGGPILSQVTSACYGLIDSMWISRSIGEVGLTATSTSYVVDYIGLAFGHFINVAASSQISYMFGIRSSEIGQLVVDMIRVCFILGVLVPAVLIPVSKPLMMWLSDNNEKIVEMAFYYLLPVLVGAITAMIFLLGCGILQAEGRTWWFALAQISSCILNGLVFDPLFLFGIKTDVWGGAMSTMIAELIPGVVIMFFLARGHLTISITPSMFKHSFSPATAEALRVGASSLIMHLSNCIPAIVMQKYMSIIATKVGEFDDIMAIWNVVLRLNQLAVSVVIAFTTAYLPAASYAFGQGNWSRIARLTFHTLWITLLWAALSELIICVWPELIGRIWSERETFLKWTNLILPRAFKAIVVCPFPYVCIAFLQAIKRHNLGSLLSVLCNFLPLPVFSTIMYLTDKTNPVHLFWAYVLKDGFSLVASIAVVAYPFVQAVIEGRERKKQKKLQLLQNI